MCVCVCVHRCLSVCLCLCITNSQNYGILDCRFGSRCIYYIVYEPSKLRGSVTLGRPRWPVDSAIPQGASGSSLVQTVNLIEHGLQRQNLMGLSTQHMNVNNPGDCLLRESTSAAEVDKRTVE